MYLVQVYCGFYKGVKCFTTYTVYCTVFSVCCTMYVVYSTLYNLRSTLYILQYTLYTVQGILYAVYCIIYTQHSTLHIIHCILHNAQCTIYYNIHCPLYKVYCTLYTLWYTLYSENCINNSWLQVCQEEGREDPPLSHTWLYWTFHRDSYFLSLLAFLFLLLLFLCFFVPPSPWMFSSRMSCKFVTSLPDFLGLKQFMQACFLSKN